MSNNSGSSSDNFAIIGGVVGGVVGGVILLIIIVVLCIVCIRRSHRKDTFPVNTSTVAMENTVIIDDHIYNSIDSHVSAAITTTSSYDVPNNKPYSTTSGDERNFVQPNEVIQQSYGEENKRDTNPSYRVDTGGDRVLTVFSTTSDTKSHQQTSHDDTTKEYDYVYARDHGGHLLHHNTAANTTGDTKKDYTQILDQGLDMKNVHSLRIPNSDQPSNEGKYGVINQPKSDYVDYETTGDDIKNVHSLHIPNSDQPSNEGEYGVINQPKSDYVDYETAGDAKGQIHVADDQSYNTLTAESAKPDGEGEAT